MNWMIYGASGFTGTLVAEEALRRGHHPMLAGRSAAKLAPLAARLGLDYVAFDLKKLDSITKAINGYDLVFHAAGPFIQTSDPMLRACILTGTNYVDISGEYMVFENTFAYDEAARKMNIALIPGAGFDIVPSECLANYVAAQVPGATSLDIGLAGLSRLSAGTAISGLGLAAAGGCIRHDGSLVPYPLGAGRRRIQFSKGELSAIPVPWGDLSAAYRSTGIPNIIDYMAVPGALAVLVRITAPFVQVLLVSETVRNIVGSIANKIIRGPNENFRQSSRAYLWARAADSQGNAAEAWLETTEPYRFTAAAGMLSVERLLAERPTGMLTPAQAFGADFVLEVEGTRRLDTLPGD
jgi:short subunit dehydrogenase-like uncharacterized protein